ncbi:(-)-isopiperitenol/(-)-carveol dehydrogenase, mitochondrial-like [Pistacia vera]|uniref:(-)-isopiperitenol/(-)-carveol dehydrogenase, mitochondrial-like n=1 Tax=Pistacia vera TaxID=55513 RepID=UPI001262C42F|nr:(-)-isopiperitenol/(-)-carveol dehydrogenase, mitochondrial-like [Pistacia vera]
MSESMLSPKKLKGKVAIITGGASGIGEATARLFAKHGARMIVIADIHDLGQQLATSIGTDNCIYMYCDVTNENQVEALVDSTLQNYGQLDIMFGNAGILNSKPPQTVLDLDLSAFDHLFAINARGMAACVKHAAPAMVERRMKGSIVCTASVTGSRGGYWMTDYYMSKHAVIGLVRSESTQLGAHGIRMNCVSPCGVATPGLCRWLNIEAVEVERMYEPNPCLKGIVIKTKHIADAVSFLASDDSEFVSGHDLVVDGGFLSKLN